MGTHAIVTIKNDGTPLVRMYTQMDGYPESMGARLYKFLAPFKLVNGLRLGEVLGQAANGAECLAAQMVAHFKTEVGMIYLVAEGSWDVDYTYEVNIDGNKFGPVVVKEGEATLFQGSLREFGDWLKRQAEEEEE